MAPRNESSEFSPCPVDGTEILLSKSKAGQVGLILVLALCFGTLLVYGFIRGMIDPDDPRQLSRLHGLLGCALILSGYLGGLRLRSALLHRRRLVIGKDVFQIQEGSDDQIVVKLQIPYSAFGEVEFVNIAFGLGKVEIVLSDAGDPAVYVPGHDLEGDFERTGRHLVLRGQYDLPGSKVASRIRRAIARWRDNDGA